LKLHATKVGGVLKKTVTRIRQKVKDHAAEAGGVLYDTELGFDYTVSAVGGVFKLHYLVMAAGGCKQPFFPTMRFPSDHEIPV
jgi:hypothetical protein